METNNTHLSCCLKSKRLAQCLVRNKEYTFAGILFVAFVMTIIITIVIAVSLLS